MKETLTKQTKTYAETRSYIQTGDVIVFGDDRDSAELLKWVSRYPVTSIGIALSVDERMFAGSTEDLAESTQHTTRYVKLILETARHNLVQISRLSTRIAECDGEVWHLPIKKNARKAFGQEFSISKLIEDFESRVSTGQMTAIESAISGFGVSSENMEVLIGRYHGATLFALLLDQAGLLGSISVDQVNNVDVCQMALYSLIYTQLKGDPSVILPKCGSNEDTIFISNQ